MIRLPSICKFTNIYRTQNVCNSGIRQLTTSTFPLCFKVSPALWAEPKKKKRRIDPAIIKAREDRKRKRLEREIRRLMRIGKQLKPVYELEVPESILNEPEKRKREIVVPEQVVEERIKLFKEWSKYGSAERKSDIQLIDRLLYAQQQALDELKLESEELYQAAVQIDSNLIPFKFNGPNETPASTDYPILDGDYIDESKKWL